MVINCRYCGGGRPVCPKTNRCRGCGMEKASCTTPVEPKGKRPCPVCMSKRVTWCRGEARLQCVQCRTVFEPYFGEILYALADR